ncbi:unnamed protein product [Symbiodinium sp. KB8]|nr:unnamed protein product [Symbiodinium sp. KB8]
MSDAEDDREQGDVVERQDEDEQDEEKPVRLYKATCVSGGGLGSSVWLPEVTVVGGQEFLRFSKWDRDLTKLCTKKPMNLWTSGKKPLNNINVELFSQLASLRMQACNQALKKVMEQAAEAEGVPLPSKIRQATAQDAFVAGQSVVIQAPAILNEDGDEIEEERPIRVLWGVRGQDLWMEATEDVIRYFIAGVKHSKPYEQPVSKRAKQGKGASPKKRRRRGPKPKQAREESDHEHPAINVDE